LGVNELAKDPQRAQALTAEQVAAALAQLHAEQGRLAALEGALVDRLLALQAKPSQAAPAGSELTSEQVAERLNRPVGYVRDLLRRKDLPGFRRGKYWVVPEGDLLASQAARKKLDGGGSTTLPLVDDARRGQTHPQAARPDTVEIRRAGRSARGDRQKVGDGKAGHAAHQ
jgi:hypothetical protein